MLVLSRFPGERIVLTLGKTTVEVTCLGREGGQYRIGIAAPKEVLILRAELKDDGRRRDAR